MTVGSPTLGETIARYMGAIKLEERSPVQAELARFMRWLGPDEPISSIDARTVETYQEQVAISGANQAQRLEPVRAFLTYAQKEGLLTYNVAKFIKLKRSAGRRDTRGGQLEEEVTQLTSEGYVKLKEELERLTTVERSKVAQELWEARQDKDIRENAPYDAAKQHQAFVEARIRDLQRLVATAVVVNGDQTSDRINVGSRVVLRDLTHDEELAYKLVGPQEANPRAGRISIASPVGRALLDRMEGEVVEVEAPVGTMQYRIERIER